MAVIHVAFDVDADVHPELHALLSSIGSEASRGERFRQLAATGLVWERLRLHGETAAAATSSPAPLTAAAAVTPLSAVAPVAVAAPAQGPLDVDRELPVLVDVVDVVDPAEAPRLEVAAPPPSPSTRTKIAAAAMKVPADAAQRSARAARPADEVVDIRAWAVDEASGVVSPSSVLALPKSTGARPRLMRMKEKGLFKNG